MFETKTSRHSKICILFHKITRFKNISRYSKSHSRNENGIKYFDFYHAPVLCFLFPCYFLIFVKFYCKHAFKSLLVALKAVERSHLNFSINMYFYILKRFQFKILYIMFLLQSKGNFVYQIAQSEVHMRLYRLKICNKRYPSKILGLIKSRPRKYF